MLYFTGDTHGDYQRFKDPKIKKLSKKDTLFICGDFGFLWDGTEEEKKLLKKIGKKPFDTLFVEGCHDAYPLLETYPVVSYRGGSARKISGNLYQLLRGEIYEIEGKTVFAFGGGDSGEEAMLNPAARWYKQEAPTVKETQAGLENLKKHGNKVDYIITHDAPESIRRLFIEDQQKASFIHRYLETLLTTVSFTHWYFGAYHTDRIIPPRYTALFSRVTAAQNPSTEE